MLVGRAKDSRFVLLFPFHEVGMSGAMCLHGEFLNPLMGCTRQPPKCKSTMRNVLRVGFVIFTRVVRLGVFAGTLENTDRVKRIFSFVPMRDIE